MTPWVNRLIIANVAMFVLTMAAPQVWFGLSLVPILAPLRPWTIVTYMFLHGGVWHLVFNMLGLYFLGPQVENRLGSRGFLGLYFAAGIVAALAMITSPHARVVGASGAVFGVLFAFARFWPRARLLIWGIFPMEARWFVLLLAAASVYMGYTGRQGGVAHFAHLGGFLGGYLFLKWLELRSPARRFRERADPTPKPSADPAADVRRWNSISLDGLHPVNRDEVERLLAKVAERGPSGLTPDERAFLHRFSN